MFIQLKSGLYVNTSYVLRIEDKRLHMTDGPPIPLSGPAEASHVARLANRPHEELLQELWDIRRAAEQIAQCQTAVKGM